MLSSEAERRAQRLWFVRESRARCERSEGTARGYGEPLDFWTWSRSESKQSYCGSTIPTLLL